MGFITTFFVSYIISGVVYYLWYMKRTTLEKNEFLKKILFFVLSIAMMLTAMYIFVEELNPLVVTFAFIGVVLVTDNVLIHTYFPKGTLNVKKIDYFLPGIINTTIIFALLYVMLF